MISCISCIAFWCVFIYMRSTKSIETEFISQIALCSYTVVTILSWHVDVMMSDCLEQHVTWRCRSEPSISFERFSHCVISYEITDLTFCEMAEDV